MNTWDDINLCCKRSDLCNLSSVRTLVVLKNHLTNCLLLILIYSIIYESKPLLVISKSLA